MGRDSLRLISMLCVCVCVCVCVCARAPAMKGLGGYDVGPKEKEAQHTSAGTPNKRHGKSGLTGSVDVKSMLAEPTSKTGDILMVLVSCIIRPCTNSHVCREVNG